MVDMFFYRDPEEVAKEEVPAPAATVADTPFHSEAPPSWDDAGAAQVHARAGGHVMRVIGGCTCNA